MFKLVGRLLVVVALGWAGFANAGYAPILSQDGSLLRNVNVNGVYYDVTFGDGIVGDVYAGITFDGEWSNFANALSDAIVVSLNGLPNVPLPEEIKGCEMFDNNESPNFCNLFIPDSFDVTDLQTWIYLDYAMVTGHGSQFLPDLWGQPYIGLASPEDNSDGPSWTLVSYSPSTTVPIPTTLALLGLGLAALGCSRRTD